MIRKSAALVNKNIPARLSVFFDETWKRGEEDKKRNVLKSEPGAAPRADASGVMETRGITARG